MGTHHRRSNPPVAELLFEKPSAFQFVQAVRILQKLRPTNLPLGDSSLPDEDAVIFKSHVSFSFKSSDLYELNASPSGPPRLTVNFMGVAGNTGPLPAPYMQMVINSSNHFDNAFKDFLDIFNHRLISILYSIRKKYRLGIDETPSEDTSVGSILKALLGFGFRNTAFSENFPIPVKSLLNFAGLYWPVQRSLVGLVKILQTFFSVPVSTSQFTGRWIYFPEKKMSLLSNTKQYNILGKNFTLGAKAWDKACTFTICLGPLTLDQFSSFLPIGDYCKSFCALTSFYVRVDKSFDLELTLKPEEVPSLTLGQTSYLGWKTWLKTLPFGPNPGKVRLLGNHLPLLEV